MLSFLRNQGAEDSANQQQKTTEADKTSGDKSTKIHDEEYLTVEAGKKGLSKNTILLFVLFGIGGLSLLFMIKKSTPQKIAKSQVTHLGPAVEMIPARLWKSPDIPEYGLPVRIACNPELNLLPNELVGVRGL